MLAFPWRSFLAKHHGRTAAVFRDVVREPLVTERELFEAVSASEGPTLRVYDGESIVTADGPARRDRSVAGWVRRLGRTRTIEAPAIVVNHLQAGSWRVFSRSLALLAPLQARIGVPTGGALLDLFAGENRRSPLGVHKDQQDVFTFVLRGRKRFLVWPYETFRAGVARHAPRILEGLDPDAVRARATVLEAGPGDLVYWPASAWHYAESDGGFTSTLALGIFPHTAPLELLERTARELRLRDETFASRTDTRRALRDALASSAAREAERVVLETWRSALGYARVPPLRACRLGTMVQVDVPATLRWVEARDRIVICASGHALRVPRHRGIVALLARLQKGRAEKVAPTRELDEGTVRFVLGFLARTATLRTWR